MPGATPADRRCRYYTRPRNQSEPYGALESRQHELNAALSFPATRGVKTGVAMSWGTVSGRGHVLM